MMCSKEAKSIVVNLQWKLIQPGKTHDNMSQTELLESNQQGYLTMAVI